MIFEILIIISAVAIFVILARRLPESDDSLRLTKDGEPLSLSGLNIGSRLGRAVNKFKVNLPKRTNQSKASKTNERDEVVSDVMVKDLTSEAESLLKSGDLKTAEKLYLKAVSKDPRNPKIYSHLGIIYLQTESFKDARDSFLAALKIDDTVASRHFNLGLAYLGLKTEAKAKVSIKKAISLDPDNKKYSQTLDEIN